MRTHRILASQKRADRRAEIQIVLLQERRGVAAVRVSTPNAESTPGLQHSRSTAEPRIQQAIDSLKGHNPESAVRVGAEPL